MEAGGSKDHGLRMESMGVGDLFIRNGLGASSIVFCLDGRDDIDLLLWSRAFLFNFWGGNFGRDIKVR